MQSNLQEELERMRSKSVSQAHSENCTMAEKSCIQCSSKNGRSSLILTPHNHNPYKSNPITNLKSRESSSNINSHTNS